MMIVINRNIIEHNAFFLLKLTYARSPHTLKSNDKSNIYYCFPKKSNCVNITNKKWNVVTKKKSNCNDNVASNMLLYYIIAIRKLNIFLQ